LVTVNIYMANTHTINADTRREQKKGRQYLEEIRSKKPSRIRQVARLMYLLQVVGFAEISGQHRSEAASRDMFT
jgi:hypothetical protein